jgi:ketosteroid isomerase-like protein
MLLRMQTFRVLGVACWVLRAGCVMLAAIGSVTPASAQTNTTAAAAEVAAVERAFAKTMADRDHAAFMSFLSEEAVFMPDGAALRGKAAVAAAWKRFYDALAAPFSWEPDRVEVLDSGTLALSSGPVRDPQGNRAGTFNSVWRREAGGWKIVFDKGCPRCDCK